VHDGRDDAPAAPPGVAVADEQAVAEQGFERFAVRRALALEAVVVGAERELDGIRRVTQENLACEQFHRHEAVFERLLLERCEQVPPPQADPLPWCGRLRQPIRIWRNEVAQYFLNLDFWPTCLEHDPEKLQTFRIR
jgi:hypothetical protein